MRRLFDRRWIMTVSASAALAIGAAGLAQHASAAIKDPDDEARTSLHTEVSEVKLLNANFSDAIDTLRDLTNANINVHWKILEAAGVEKTVPITLRVRGVRLRKALELVLADAGGKVPLTWYVDQGVIEITTQEEADSKLVTRVYVVGDLTVDIPNFSGPQIDLTSSTSGGSSGGSGGGSSGGNSPFGNSSSNSQTDKPMTEQQRGDQLVTTITTSIRPDIWKVNGGTASIAYFHGRLVVTAPRSVQEQIGGSMN